MCDRFPRPVFNALNVPCCGTGWALVPPLKRLVNLSHEFTKGPSVHASEVQVGYVEVISPVSRKVLDAGKQSGALPRNELNVSARKILLLSPVDNIVPLREVDEVL